MCSSLIEIGSKTAEKNSAQTNKPTDTTKIMVTWLWTKKLWWSLKTIRSQAMASINRGLGHQWQ